MENLCLKCNMDPIFLDGLCEDCYEEQFEEDLMDEKGNKKMPVHGASLKNPETMNRSISKISKIRKNK